MLVGEWDDAEEHALRLDDTDPFPSLRDEFLMPGADGGVIADAA
jgi:hypothetical protein